MYPLRCGLLSYVSGLMKERLSIDGRGEQVTIRWRHAGLVDIFAWVALPMAAAWGIGSALGRETVLGMRVLPMSWTVTGVFWTVIAVVGLHLAFNRGVQISIDGARISYAYMVVPPVRRSWRRDQLQGISVETREDALAESGPDGRTPRDSCLRVCFRDAAPLVIRGLSHEDAEKVRAELQRNA